MPVLLNVQSNGFYPAGVTEAEINAAAGRDRCPDGCCPLCFLHEDFPGALRPSWLDARGEPVDADNGLCEECYANWLEVLKDRIRWRARQVERLEAELAAARSSLQQVAVRPRRPGRTRSGNADVR
jgi:hypothetical protein